MTRRKTTAPETAAQDTRLPDSDIDVGRPVEWMVDPDRPDFVLGVTYEFAQSKARKTVWYTPNKRRVKACRVVNEFPSR